MKLKLDDLVVESFRTSNGNILKGGSFTCVTAITERNAGQSCLAPPTHHPCPIEEKSV